MSPKMSLIRAHRSGVWGGVEIDDARDGFMRIRGRRLWSWTEALDCSTLAVFGPGEGSQISATTTVEIRLDDIVEVHRMTDEAWERVTGAPVAR